MNVIKTVTVKTSIATLPWDILASVRKVSVLTSRRIKSVTLSETV